MMVDKSADEAATMSDSDRGAQDSQKLKRQQSAIPFPYIPLPDVVQLVRVVEQRGHTCRVEEAAADLGQQMTSGAFRSRLSAGRMFGAIDIARRDVRLTDLGLAICNSQTEPAALADAFLRVPLYQKVYQQFAGTKLPPDEGIEQAILRLGVPAKQVAKARQVLFRSAETAGYFSNGRDRLIRPAASSLAPEPGGALASRDAPVPQAEAVAMGDHPLIKGLVAKLPAEGQRFTPRQRQRWLDAAKVNLELIYAADDEEDEKPVPESAPNGVAGAQGQRS
jgi:hypothetical protein